MKPIPKYKTYQSPNSGLNADFDDSPHRGNWTHETIYRFGCTQIPIKIGQQPPEERYKWISMKYDMERDNRLAEAEKEFMKEYNLKPQDKIQMAQFQDMKLRIEWDVAWRIFDHVNESNDVSKTIDLNCLDIFEAESITKQKIYEAARLVQNSG